MAKKPRKRWRGKELPIGVSFVVRNGSAYFYVRIDGERRYAGKDQEGFDQAVVARDKWKVQQRSNRLMGIGMEDEAKKLRQEHADIKTVKQLSKWYMELPTIQNQKSYNRKVNCSTHILRYFGQMHVSQVEADDTERYREFRKGQGAADATVNLEIGILSAMYHLAAKRKKIPLDSMPGEFVKEYSAPPRREITRDEYRALLKHADSDYRDVLICAYESAMRSNEICQLRANQVHLNREYIEEGKRIMADYLYLGTIDTKTGLERYVPVSKVLKGVFLRRLKGLDPEDHVFQDKAGSYYPERVSHKLKFAAGRAGVLYGDKLLDAKGSRIGVVFHCFRHTRTVLWIRQGFSDTYIRAATGHKSLEAYRMYADKAASPAGVMRLVNGISRKRLVEPESWPFPTDPLAT